MKINKIIFSSLLLVLALQFKVFAGDNSFIAVSKADLLNSKKPIHMECKDGCKKYHHWGHSAINILKNKYGVKSEEIEKAMLEGKTIFHIAKDKNVTQEDLKALMMSPKIKAIEEMVVTGELSKENADNMKIKLKEGLDKWDGKFEHMKSKKSIKKGTKDNKKSNVEVE